MSKENALQEFMKSIEDDAKCLGDPPDSVDHIRRIERIKNALKEAYLAGYAQCETDYKGKIHNINEDRRFRGRKLMLEWGKLKIEISKLPYQNGVKDPVFDLLGSEVVLSNVYEGADGKLIDEVLGTPAGPNGDGKCLGGMTIQEYLTNDTYWKTVDETGFEKSN